MLVFGKVSDECSGNKRCKFIVNYIGNLIIDFSVIIVIIGIKYFGKYWLLYIYYYVMRNVCQYYGEENYLENRLCFKCYKERKCV